MARGLLLVKPNFELWLEAALTVEARERDQAGPRSRPLLAFTAVVRSIAGFSSPMKQVICS
jgi:hypothetical protein